LKKELTSWLNKDLITVLKENNKTSSGASDILIERVMREIVNDHTNWNAKVKKSIKRSLEGESKKIRRK